MAEPQIAAHGATHPGRQRHEDAFLVWVPQPGECSLGIRALVAVADGAGGPAAGEVASQRAVTLLREAFERTDVTTPFASGEQLRQYLQSTLAWLNARIFDLAPAGTVERPTTTLTAAVVLGEWMALAHVGDSRAWLVHDGRIEAITQDHTFTTEQLARGTMTEEQAQASPYGSQLTRALGLMREVEADISVGRLQPGDLVLLTTAGLHQTLAPADLLQVVLNRASVDTNAQDLVERAAAEDAADNCTVAVLQYGPHPAGGRRGGRRTEPAPAPLPADDLAPTGAPRADAATRRAERLQAMSEATPFDRFLKRLVESPLLAGGLAAGLLIVIVAAFLLVNRHDTPPAGADSVAFNAPASDPATPPVVTPDTAAPPATVTQADADPLAAPDTPVTTTPAEPAPPATPTGPVTVQVRADGNRLRLSLADDADAPRLTVEALPDAPYEPEAAGDEHVITLRSAAARQLGTLRLQPADGGAAIPLDDGSMAVPEGRYRLVISGIDVAQVVVGKAPEPTAATP